MRRGHPGIRGWRNSNPRHFRPHNGGIPPFRPARNFPLLDMPRFLQSGPRPLRGPHPYSTHPGPTEVRLSHEYHDRNKYRHISQHRPPERKSEHVQKHNYPPVQNMRHVDHSNMYKDTSKYYENQNSEQYHVNSMGDIDHRHLFNISHNRESYSQDQTSSRKIHIDEDRRKNFDERNQQNVSYKHIDNSEVSKVPVTGYIGHRPPSSDHYGNNLGTPNDDSNAFSCSIDDTVNIVRKRILHRNDPSPIDEPSAEKNHVEQTDLRENVTNVYQNEHQEQPKRRIQKQRQNVNCNKIKNKIVHQLFKMDKDKMCKLMDNPSSSTKFEYAISSLITESQNSYNRHMRSVAEKSLCCSNTEIIHSDNDKIYEDTFMKQMQCILDPQDTVLLEDIKPMVLAELSKVLHLDAFDQRFEMPEEQTSYLNTFCMQENNQNYDQYSNELYNFENYSHYGNENENSAYTEQCDQSRSIHDNNTNSEFVDQMSKNFEYHRNADSKLFERRPTRKSFDNSQDTKAITENQRRLSRKSVDNRLNEDSYESSKPLPQRSATPGPPRCRTPLPSISGTQLPLFDANTEQFYEDEDPFAELDKQYHVAVDHNFIETDEPQQTNFRSTPVNRELVSDINSPENNLYEDIEKEIDSQLETIAKSPIKLYSSKIQTEPPVLHVEFSTLSDQSSIERTPKTETIKEDVSVFTNNNNNTENNVLDNSNMNEEHLNTEAKDVQLKESENSITLEKSPIPTISRKRSVDQRPSHRKEKRKKSETESKESEPNKQMLNKNIIININDCVGKTPEKCDASKSMFNLYFSKNENKQVSKDNKTISSINDKAYSDKYVKRKEPSKKSKVKETENKNKRSFSTPSHSMLSPKESNITSSFNQTPKETKIKLKTIDMFLDQPRKVNIHQSYRNTSSSATITKNTQENKTNPTVTNSDNTSVMARGVKKFQSKLTQTSISKCSTSRFCQTETKKLVVKTVQTDPVVFSKSSSKSTDAFERMKEIDCEIQVLLQEKFKLYNSLESKHSYQKSTMQTFGMTVLNVNEVEETKENDTADSLSGDAIIEDFTNIPVEELEQIAFETVQDESISHETPKVKKRTQRLRVLKRQRKSSENSITAVKRSNRKSKTPNISLIEQIITDDRPLEDIISLEDLEVPPVKTKTKKKAQKPQQKAKKNLKMNPGKPIDLSKFKIRDCSVFVIREDLSKYLEKKTPKPVIQEDTNKEESVEQSNIVEETVLNDNDIQFDMLDVSEDIIIGEDHEVKLTDDKDEMERIDVSISEEIILDNSQSSMEDVMISDMEQVNNECRTYDYSSDESMRRDSITVTGNADAVLAIECIENKFLAACLDGNVYYFNADGLLLNTLRGSNLAVTCLTIVKENHGTTVYTGSLDSRIRYYDLESGLERGPECNVLSPIQTMDRAWDTVFVGTRTGFVLQFECKNNMLIPVSTVKFSEQSILALRAMKEGPRKVLLVAARSENVTIRDAQTGLLLRSLVGPKMTVYTLLYEDAKVYCGTSSHQIHMFDYTSGSHVGTHEGGKGAVCLRVAGGLLFAGCYDGCVYVYRDGECTPFAQLRGPSLMLLSLAILDTKIIAGYKDRSLYIWKIPNNVMQEMIL